MAEIVNETEQDMSLDGGIVKKENTDESEEKKPFDFSKQNQLKTKPIPAITTLLAGAVVSIVTFVNRYPLLKALEMILLFMVIFLLVGDIIKFVIDRFIIESEKEEEEDLEAEAVIEKNPETEEEAEEGIEG